MRLKLTVLSYCASLILCSNLLGADKFEFDVSHTMIGFSVRHMAITNIRGNFTDFSGTFLYDGNDISRSSINVTIQTASINTNNEKRDNHLRSADFFNAKKYPEITFISKRFEKSGDGYQVIGTLTMHGVSKEVTIPFLILGKIKDPRGNTRIGLEGSFKLNRQDYGVLWSRTLDSGGLVVGNEVKIELSAEGVSKKQGN